MSSLTEIGEAAQRTTAALQRLREVLNELEAQANSSVRLAGLEGRYYVRGAMEVKDIVELNQLVSSLLSPRPEKAAILDLALVTPANRAMLAAAAVKGFVTHREQASQASPPVWHRYLAAAGSFPAHHLEVGCD